MIFLIKKIKLYLKLLIISKSDLWSLGILFFALISGYLPFDDPNTDKLYDQVLSGIYEIPEHFS